MAGSVLEHSWTMHYDALDDSMGEPSVFSRAFGFGNTGLLHPILLFTLLLVVPNPLSFWRDTWGNKMKERD